MSGGPRGWRRRSLAGAIGVSVLFLLLPAAVATGGTGLLSSRPLVVHTAAGTTVQMTVGAGGGFVFTPDTISNVAPGSTVTIQIRNLGTVPHTFTLSSLVNYTLPYASNTNLTSVFLVQHPALVSVNIPDVQGGVTPVTFTAPTTIGSYQFFCQVPGHFATGMEGLLGVGISVSGPGAPPGIGPPVFIISGTIVGLVIAAIVLGFVVGQREGTKHEMPPERLGYSEISSPTVPAKPPY
ncbi:MAG: plastocyanin/azurin family copper-binding protein [Thermoplasmata archaeon]|nr:plastocyanin/azurin family copper-binding protein [Thermoplasmata archaeon]